MRPFCSKRALFEEVSQSAIRLLAEAEKANDELAVFA